MDRRFLFFILAPTVVISVMMLSLGVLAAWNVQRQHATTSELVAGEVHSMVTAQELLIVLRDIRIFGNKFLRTGEDRQLDQIEPLEQRGQVLIAEMRKLAATPDEQAATEKIAEAFAEFFRSFHELRATSAQPETQVKLGAMFDELLSENAIEPVQKLTRLNRNIVDVTNEASRETTNQMRQAFLLLGICGCGAGLVAGVAFARGISQSIVRIDVSVKGAADKLTQVVGPVTVSRVASLRQLEMVVRQMESHITEVVSRLQEREAEILRAEQLAAVGQLAAGLAHELRNPLTPIKMLVQAAIERDDEIGIHGRQLVVLEEEIGHLENSIQTFLDFARPPRPEKTTFDANDAVAQTFELLAARADSHGVQLEHQQSLAGPAWIEADHRLICQVILNLALNALDAMPNGGRIDASVQVEPHLAWTGGTGAVVLRISDTGEGLKEDQLDQIFEPFISTKETGTGLGLSICRRVVETHGGLITAANRPEGGAQFTICLPIAQAP